MTAKVFITLFLNFLLDFFQVNRVAIVNTSKGENLVCLKCDKEFRSRLGLKQHMQLHTGQFRYFCDSCRKGYNTNQAYKVHMDKHRGIQYECEFCSKSFTNQQSRDYHRSVHTGLYRFNCDICEKGFNVKSDYGKHVDCHL